jgi:hypothetical protein
MKLLYNEDLATLFKKEILNEEIYNEDLDSILNKAGLILGGSVGLAVILFMLYKNPEVVAMNSKGFAVMLLGSAGLGQLALSAPVDKLMEWLDTTKEGQKNKSFLTKFVNDGINEFAELKGFTRKDFIKQIDKNLSEEFMDFLEQKIKKERGFFQRLKDRITKGISMGLGVVRDYTQYGKYIDKE